MAKPVRVLSFIEAHTVTGPAKNLLTFCSALKRHPEHRTTVELVTFLRTNAGESSAFIDTVRGLNIPLHLIGERHAFDIRVIAQIRRLLEREQPDIVETNAVKAHLLMRLFRPAGRKWVAFNHGYTAENLKVRLYNQLDRISLPKADRVIAVCGPFAERLVRRGVPATKIRVLPNAIDAQPATATHDVRQQFGIGPSAPLLLAVGRLSPEKGHGDLLQAMQGIPAHCHLLLVGDGPERKRLEEQTRNLGLTSRVHFAGHQADPLPYFAEADVFVLPSLSEGSPLVLLEAMAARTPIVATNAGGIPETVRDEHSALLVPSADPAALAAAINRMLQEDALRETLAANAARDVAVYHSPDQYCASLVNIYRELLAAAG